MPLCYREGEQSQLHGMLLVEFVVRVTSCVGHGCRSVQRNWWLWLW